MTTVLVARVWLPSKMISGGQTGADRAGLGWARTRGIEQGGWCPRGRRALDGPLPPASAAGNAVDSLAVADRVEFAGQRGGVDIFNLGRLAGGALETLALAESLGKPCRVFQLDRSPLDGTAREEQRPGIEGFGRGFKPARIDLSGPQRGG